VASLASEYGASPEGNQGKEWAVAGPQTLGKRGVWVFLTLREGYPVKREDVAALSPYLTRHVKRFGDYFIDVSVPPQPLAESELALPL
jgi:hypothetical protein